MKTVQHNSGIWNICPRAWRIILCFLLSLIAGIGTQPSCTRPTHVGDAVSGHPEALIDRVRRAVGYQTLRSLEEGLSVEGTGEYLGLPSTFRMVFSPQGAYRSEIISRLRFIEGFDGQRGWIVDETGMPGYMELTTLEQSKIMAWTTGGYWLDPECPLLVDWPSWSPGDTAVAISLSLPEGIIRATMILDPRSLLPRRCRWTSFGQESYIEWSRWKDAGGFPFPGEILSWAEFQEIRIRIDTVRPAGEGIENLTREVTRPPRDTRFYPERGSAVPLIRIPSGNLAVYPQVNGQEVGWFLLDTGAGRSVIDIARADWLEFVFHRNAPLLSCSFDGDHTALFDLDTGFPGMVTFNRAFAERSGLLDELDVETFTAGGVGGTMEMQSGQLERLEIGGRHWEQVPFSVAGEAQGVLADEAVGGPDRHRTSGFLSGADRLSQREDRAGGEGLTPTRCDEMEKEVRSRMNAPLLLLQAPAVGLEPTT